VATFDESLDKALHWLAKRIKYWR